MAKAMAWGIGVLISAFLVVSGGVGMFLHSASLRDVEETTAKASNVVTEANALYESIQSNYREMIRIKDDVEKVDEFLRIRGAIDADGRRLFQILNFELCGDSFGCAFSKYSGKYDRFLNDWQSRVSEEEATSYWALDVLQHINRQSDREMVSYQNGERWKAIIGSGFVLLIGFYFLLAFSRFKNLLPSDYVALSAIAFLPLSWAVLAATNYVDPMLVVSTNVLPINNASEIVFFGSFIYPFLVAPPIYVFLKSHGLSFANLVLLKSR